MKILLPTIHLNGTGRQTLKEEYDAAAAALYAFIGKWEAITFNARDYYPQGDEAFEAAREQREIISASIAWTREYLAEIRCHLYNS